MSEKGGFFGGPAFSPANQRFLKALAVKKLALQKSPFFFRM